MEINATFKCLDCKNQLIIQCKAEDKISTILQKFCQKTFAEIEDFEYTYNDKVINEKDKELTIMKSMNNDKNIKEIEILVKRLKKIIKCPICACNNCILKIVKDRLHFSDCCKNHKEIRLLEEYEDTQTVNYQKIKCDNQCGRTQKDSLEEFHKCLDCTNLAGYAIYYCNECNNLHKKKHKTIKYSDKYYYCSKHYGVFISYCSECNYNLCQKCEEIHEKNHQITKFDALNPNLDDTKKNLEIIKKKIDDLKDIVRMIKNKLDGAIKIIERYFDIANDIIKIYETFNSKLKNYQILKTINYLSSSNNEILQKIENIIKGNEKKEDWLKKCSILLDIIEKDRSEYNNEKTEPNDDNDDNLINEINDNIIELNNYGSNKDFDLISLGTRNASSISRKIYFKKKQKGSNLFNKNNINNK